MKKYLYLLFAFISILSVSCNDDDDVMDTKLIKGQWELVSADNPDRGCIYDFTTQSENTWSWGKLNTYYLTASGTPVHDKTYDWHVSDPANYETVYLDITLADETDGDDVWENTDYYIVESLTASEMILHEADDTDVKLRFIRRNDLPQLQ